MAYEVHYFSSYGTAYQSRRRYTTMASARRAARRIMERDDDITIAEVVEIIDGKAKVVRKVIAKTTL